MTGTRREVASMAVVMAVAAVLAACSSDRTASEATARSTGVEVSASVVDPPPTSVPTGSGADATGAGSSGSSSAAAATTTVAAGASGDPCSTGAPPGLRTVSFEFEDRDRVYELYVPTTDGTTPLPLVLNWHGLGSTGPQQLAFSEYARTAEAEGFAVAAPTGVPGPGDSQNSWELTDDADPTRDDVAFAEAVLDHVATQVCVDADRIYSTGMSNGGYFTSRLVCELADRIAAAASVAGLTHEDDCRPSEPVPYLAFHGVDDEIVPYDGDGYSSLFPGQYLELMDRSIADELAEFAADFGCSENPAVELVDDDVTRIEHQGCDDGAEVVLYAIDGAGHTWPGSRSSRLISETAGLGVTSLDVSATELSWEFFERHRR